MCIYVRMPERKCIGRVEEEIKRELEGEGKIALDKLKSRDTGTS